MIFLVVFSVISSVIGMFMVSSVVVRESSVRFTSVSSVSL